MRRAECLPRGDRGDPAGLPRRADRGVPLNEDETVTLTAAGASYFSASRLTEIAGASIRVTDTVTGIPADGDQQIAVWNESSLVYDTTNRRPLESASRTFAFDRKTAELVNCCGESVNGNPAISQSGIAGFAFPVGTKKQAYDVFDPVLDKPEPFAYSGSDVVDGIPASRFTENISAANISAARAGLSPPEFYSTHSMYWIDPQTGALLKISANEDLYLASAAAGTPATHMFNAKLNTTPATVASLVGHDILGRERITAMETVLRVALATAGALAVAAVILLGGTLRAFAWRPFGKATVPRSPRRRHAMPSRSRLARGVK